VNHSANKSKSVPDAEFDALLDELDAALYRMSRVMTSRHSDLYSSSGMSPAQFMLLRTLHIEGPLRVSEIADLLGMKNPAASMLIDGLENEGFVSREHDEEDRRVVKVSLTGSGRKRAAKAEAMRRKMMRTMTSTLAADDIRHIVRIQKKMIDSLTANAADVTEQ